MAFLTKRKNGVFYICWLDDNKKRNFQSTGTKLKKTANDVLAAFIQESRQYNKHIGIENILTRFIDYNSEYSESTKKLYRFTVNNLVQICGNKKIDKYKYEDIEKFILERGKKVNNNSLNIELRCLKALFNYTIKSGYLNKNIIKKFRQKEIPEQKRMAFNDEQYNEIIENCNNEILRNIIRFAYYTGCREKEISNIRINNIDTENNLICIENTGDFRTKNKKNRYIPISDKISDILKIRILDENNYIFSMNGKKIREEYISKGFKKLLRKLKYNENYNFHCLRHSFISNLVRKGFDLNTVKDLAGHSSIKTTEKYMHTSIELKRNAINSL